MRKIIVLFVLVRAFTACAEEREPDHTKFRYQFILEQNVVKPVPMNERVCVEWAKWYDYGDFMLFADYTEVNGVGLFYANIYSNFDYKPDRQELYEFLQRGGCYIGGDLARWN
jgi:hypothetical protein